MDELNEKINQGYDSTELPEELRLRVRQKFLAAAETRPETERSITMSKKLKRPIAVAVIAAAALTATVTAGALKNVKFHNESIDVQLGAGAADIVASEIEIKSYSVENEYMRITADAVFSDGDSVTFFLTTEKLKDPALGWEVREDGSYVRDWIGFEAFYEDGTAAGNGSHCSYANDKPAEDGVQYARYTVNNIESGRPIVLTVNDQSKFIPLWESMNDEDREELIAREDYEEYVYAQCHPETVQGLSMTIDTAPNFTPVTYENSEGVKIYLTPYSCYTYSYDIDHDHYGRLTLKNSSTGEELGDLLDSAGGDRSGYYSYSFDKYIADYAKYDTIEIENVGSFYKK